MEELCVIGKLVRTVTQWLRGVKLAEYREQIAPVLWCLVSLRLKVLALFQE